MPTHIDTSYRTWPAEDLAALRVSILTQLKAIEGIGQSHSGSGRSTSMVDFDKLTQKLASINAAIAWQANLCDGTNNGFATRLTNFNT